MKNKTEHDLLEAKLYVTNLNVHDIIMRTSLIFLQSNPTKYRGFVEPFRWACLSVAEQKKIKINDTSKYYPTSKTIKNP